MAQIVSVTQAKQRLLELARRNEELGESFVLVRDAKPVSALVPFEEYEALLETLDILESEPDISAKLKRAKVEIQRGEYEVWTRPTKKPKRGPVKAGGRAKRSK